MPVVTESPTADLADMRDQPSGGDLTVLKTELDTNQIAPAATTSARVRLDRAKPWSCPNKTSFRLKAEHKEIILGAKLRDLFGLEHADPIDRAWFHLRGVGVDALHAGEDNGGVILLPNLADWHHWPVACALPFDGVEDAIEKQHATVAAKDNRLA